MGTCLCDSCDITVAIAICAAVQGPDGQQAGVLGSTKGEPPYTGSNMGAVAGTVLAHHSSGEAAEHFFGSGTRAAVCISELIMGSSDALHVNRVFFCFEKPLQK